MKITKSIVAGLAASLLLTACSSKQENMDATKMETTKKVVMTKEMAHSIASDATQQEIQQHVKYEKHIKKVKKRKKVKLKKEKIDLKKFCFKDNHSIHYKAQERCK